MATARHSISKIRAVLELGTAEPGYSVREIHSKAGVSIGSVQKVLSAALDNYRRAAGLGCAITDEELLSWVYPADRASSGPDMAKVHYLLSGGLTRRAIHAEQYWLGSPAGCKYSRFAQLYSDWLEGVPADHFLRCSPGDQCLIRSYRLELPVLDETRQESAPCSVFVAVLPASNFCYYDIYRTNSPHQRVDCIQRAFTHFGGVPRRLDITSTETLADYNALEQHFGTKVTSRKKPIVRQRRGDDVVEGAIDWARTNLKMGLAPTLADIRSALARLADHWNSAPLAYGAYECIGNAFHELDCQYLEELPEEPFAYTEEKAVRVHSDGHVQYRGAFYSVPYTLIGRSLRLEATASGVAAYDGSKRVAEHPHARSRQRYQTRPEHLLDAGSPNDRQAAFISRAHGYGAEVASWVRARTREEIYPEYAFRKCLAVFNLGNQFGSVALNRVCRRANRLGWRSSGQLKAALQPAKLWANRD